MPSPNGRIRARRVLGLVGVIVAAGTVVTHPATPHALATAADASAFTPIPACRVFDSRTAGLRLGSRSAVRITVAGRCGVGANPSAVALTVTVADPAEAGYLAVTPSTAAPHGDVATLGQVAAPGIVTVHHEAGEVRSNGTITAVRNGAIDVYSWAAADVVVDVTGAFTPANGAVGAGRFVGIAPQRAHDSRAGGARPGAGTSTVVLPGVPSGAIAVALDVTVTDPERAGFVTVSRPGSAPGATASVTVPAAATTRSAGTIVGVQAGSVVITRSMAAHVVIDVTGWFTGAGAPPSTDGLFVPSDPVRVLDTRTGERVNADGTIRVPQAAPGAAAAVFQLAAVDAVEPGYLTAGPAGRVAPATASVTIDRAGAVDTNLLVAAVSTDGLDVHGYVSSDVVLDRTGWFTGAPLSSEGRSARNPRVVDDRRAVLISDSAFAAIRWSDQVAHLGNAAWIPLLESCRRLVFASCKGREGYAPLTVVNQLASMAGAIGPTDVLIVATGYDDWESRFPADAALVNDTATSVGFRHIVWLTYHTGGIYSHAAQAGWVRSDYGAMNAAMRALAASGRWPDVQVWDWDGLAAAHPDWLLDDGIHMTPTGAASAASWLSLQIWRWDRSRAVAVGG